MSHSSCSDEGTSVLVIGNLFRYCELWLSIYFLEEDIDLAVEGEHVRDHCN